jgi:hypothetical protein
MRILNGWKEIAECLHRTPRSARRWERLGLPVRRVSDGRRSPIIAFSDEIEEWARKRKTRMSESQSIQANFSAFRQTRDETRRLVEELRATRREHRRLLAIARDQLHSMSVHSVSMQAIANQ